MATEAQIKANRQNSQKSTGPRTAEGKRVVSQNAFKHGLFVDKAVVRDESQDEYDLRREAVLAELQPVGEMESIVAERLVNLLWRLKRAERMQNQSIDYLGIDQLAGFRAESFKERYRKANGLSSDDPAIAADHLLLGRIATRDWSNCRVLDKMMLYERRIENSMYKAIRELKRFQDARKLDKSGTVEAKVATCRGRDALETRGRDARDTLKKQSQKPALGRKSEARIPKSETSQTEKTKPISEKGKCVSTYASNDYDDRPRCGPAESKANQIQFHEPASGKGMEKRACRKVPCG